MTDDVRPLSPDQIATFLGATVVTVEAEMASHGDEGGRWRPAPGEWCANEVVGHLIEAERRGFAGRIRRILASDRPAVEGSTGGGRGARRLREERDRTRLVAPRPPRRQPPAHRRASARRSRSLRDPSTGRRAAGPRPPGRVGLPRPQSRPAAAGEQPGARLAADGQRPPVRRSRLIVERLLPMGDRLGGCLSRSFGRRRRGRRGRSAWHTRRSARPAGAPRRRPRAGASRRPRGSAGTRST